MFEKNISDKLKRNEIHDFSNLNIDGLCLDKCIVVGFNNKVVAFFDNTSLPKDYIHISQLRNKDIVYSIVTDNGKWYFGSTNDIGQRINDHLKETRNKLDKYEDYRKYGRFFIRIEHVCDDKENLRELEKDIIEKFKEKLIIFHKGKDAIFLCDLEMKNAICREYSYNKI